MPVTGSKPVYKYDEHHTQTIATLLFKLKKMTKEEEQQAWEVACSWARSKYHQIQDWICIQVAEDLDLMGIKISLRRPVFRETTAPTPHPESAITQRQTNEQPSIGDTIVSLTSSILPTTNLFPTTEPTTINNC